MLFSWAASITLSWKLLEYIAKDPPKWLFNLFFILWSLFFLILGLLLCYSSYTIIKDYYDEVSIYEIVGSSIKALTGLAFAVITFWNREDLAEGNWF